jgi:lipid-binding SYLF domain-containing protein
VTRKLVASIYLEGYTLPPLEYGPTVQRLNQLLFYWEHAMRNQHRSVLILLLSAIIATFPMACRTPAGETPAQKRASINKMRSAALADLYKELPGAKSVVDRSVGYAVFSSIGTNLLLISTARGYGVLKDKSSGKDTYMDMLSLGGGVGLGVRDFRVFFVFLEREALDRFVETGIDFGGQGNVTADSGEENDESIDLNAAQNLDSLNAAMAVFQITETGIVLQATLQGTKFTPDDELN